MYNLICLTCKKEFKNGHNKQKYCSHECYRKTDTWKRTIYKKGHTLAVGEKNGFYKHGETYKNRLWRTAVFERDNYTCQKCGTRGHYLNAHHLKEQSIYKELKYTLENGITFCRPCHQAWHKEKGILNQFNMGNPGRTITF